MDVDGNEDTNDDENSNSIIVEEAFYDISEDNGREEEDGEFEANLSDEDTDDEDE